MKAYKHKKKLLHQKGNAMAEYIIILVFMSVSFYLAIIDGVTIETTQNGLPVTLETPALTESLANHEKNFIHTLSMP